MQLLAPAPDDDDQVGHLEQQEMLGDRLPRHVEARAQFAKRLTVALVQLVEQLSAAFISQGFEYCIHLSRQEYATIWLHIKYQIENNFPLNFWTI
jgi:hypothetical protein